MNFIAADLFIAKEGLFSKSCKYRKPFFLRRTRNFKATAVITIK